MLKFIVPGIMLIISAYTDIKERVIYSEVILVFGLAGLIYGHLTRSPGYFGMLLGALVGGMMLGASFLTRGELGPGDGLLFIVTGFWLGFELNFTLLMFSLILSSVYSMGLMVFKKASRGFKSEYPFSPFILAAYIVMMIGGGI